MQRLKEAEKTDKMASLSSKMPTVGCQTSFIEINYLEVIGELTHSF